MSECGTCGRDDGHYLGCVAAFADAEYTSRLTGAEEWSEAVTCAFDDCKNFKRPKGKGPAPKYCTEHSDPKNRK